MAYTARPKPPTTQLTSGLVDQQSEEEKRRKKSQAQVGQAAGQQAPWGTPNSTASMTSGAGGRNPFNASVYARPAQTMQGPTVASFSARPQDPNNSNDMWKRLIAGSSPNNPGGSSTGGMFAPTAMPGGQGQSSGGALPRFMQTIQMGGPPTPTGPQLPAGATPPGGLTLPGMAGVHPPNIPLGNIPLGNIPMFPGGGGPSAPPPPGRPGAVPQVPLSGGNLGNLMGAILKGAVPPPPEAPEAVPGINQQAHPDLINNIPVGNVGNTGIVGPQGPRAPTPGPVPPVGSMLPPPQAPGPPPGAMAGAPPQYAPPAAGTPYTPPAQTFAPPGQLGTGTASTAPGVWKKTASGVSYFQPGGTGGVPGTANQRPPGY